MHPLFAHLIFLHIIHITSLRSGHSQYQTAGALTCARRCSDTAAVAPEEERVKA